MVVQKNTVKYVRLAIMVPKSCKHNETVQKSKYICYIDYHTLSRQKFSKQYRQFQNITPELIKLLSIQVFILLGKMKTGKCMIS